MYYSKTVHKHIQYFVYLISVDFTFDLVKSYNFLRLMTMSCSLCRPRAFCPITTIFCGDNKSPSMSWFENFYSKFPPVAGLFQGLPGQFD